jgi:hypothetical protein
MLTDGVRLVGSLDLGDITRSLATLGNPDAGFLEMLGASREERVAKMATMLRNSSDADIEEMGTIFALAMAKVTEDGAAGGEEQPSRSRPDPVTMFTTGMKRIGSLDLADIRSGLANLSRPSVGGLLGMLGRSREERVEKMATMLRNSSPAEMEELGAVYALALAGMTEKAPGVGKPRKRRDLTSAEWRKERRLAS